MNPSILILISFQGQMQSNLGKMNYPKFIFKISYMIIGSKSKRKKANLLAGQLDMSNLNKPKI